MNETNARRAVQAAEMLVREHADGVKSHNFAREFGATDPAAAYAIQREFVRLQRQSRNVGVSGYKVGLTSARMQAMCGIDSPLAGVVLSDRVKEAGVRLARSDYGRLGLEFEVAVRMARALKPKGAAATIADVAEAADAVCPAVELIDDRDPDYSALDVYSLIADNSWNAGIVLGAFQRTWPDLPEIEGVVAVDGAELDRGFGRDVLGHPFASVAWLATHLAETGSELRAGDIVMTGSIVTTKFPKTPGHYRFTLKDLGSVEVSVD